MSETPAEAEALVAHASALADGVAVHLPDWVVAVVADRSGATPAPPTALAELLDGPVAAVADQVRELLALDIDRQRTTPLALVRGLVPHLTAVLDDLGVPPRRRDPDAERLFPDDHHDLTPGALADLHDDLGPLSIAWGAAKAHVHLRRRRAAPVAPPRVVAFVPDLMDRSRFEGHDVTFVRTPPLASDQADTDLVVVDLDRIDDPDAIVGSAPVIGFVAHVESERRDRAERAGIRVLPRSRFFHDLADLLTPPVHP